jgi:DNA-binding CsgD family transcriptional regulator
MTSAAHADVEGRGAAERSAEPDASFDVFGRSFTLVSERQWLTLEAKEIKRRQWRERACGLICVAGRRHIILAQDRSRGEQKSLAEVLTQREFEIALHIARGDGNKEIGRFLGISHLTVREHVRRICYKLGVHNRSAIAAAIGPAACIGMPLRP